MKICFQFCNFVFRWNSFMLLKHFRKFSVFFLFHTCVYFSTLLASSCLHLQLCLAVRYFRILLLLSEKHNKKQVCLCKRIAKVFQLPLKEWPLNEGKTFKCKVNTTSQKLLEFIWMEGYLGRSSNPSPALAISVLWYK